MTQVKGEAVKSKRINKKATTLAQQQIDMNTRGRSEKKEGRFITQSILVDRSVSHPQIDRRQGKVVQKCPLSMPLRQVDKKQALQSIGHEKIHSLMWCPRS